MSGIFIKKGVSLRIPAGGLKFSLADGMSVEKIEVAFDVCPSWLEVALEHLRTAKAYNAERTQAWKIDDSVAKGKSLEREFKASMQAITASAIAIDSFYAALRSRIKIDSAHVVAWRKNRTARYSQVAEICRIAFKLNQKQTKILRDDFRQLFQFRDEAVHPSSMFTEPILHPELGVGVEWRFIHFRFETALPLVFGAVHDIAELTAGGSPSNDDVKNYCDYLKPQMALFRADETLAEYKPPISVAANASRRNNESMLP